MPIVRRAADVALGTAQVVKDLGRLREIVQILSKHGLGWLVASIEVPGVGMLRRIAPDQSPAQPTPERICAVVRELGPTFVKLGQVLSTRDDLVGEAYAEAFSSLQDAVTEFPYEQVQQQIRNAFGEDPETLFATIDPVPLAAASIAQVHRATLKTGEEVAVKVQRPGIRTKIQTDLSILDFLARQVDAQLTGIGVVDFSGVVAMLRRSIADETDFRIEASNTEVFAENFKDDPNIVIPAIYKDYVSAEVLTLEFIDGVKIKAAREAGYDMHVVGERYLAAAFQMLLEDGDFHGDLHPGNVLVLPNERLGLLDFGMVGRLTEDMRTDLIAIFFALQRRDYRTIARIYWELAIKPGQVDYTAWETDVQGLMERHIKGRSMADVDIADFLAELLQKASKHGVRASPLYTMFFKALITTEGLAKMLLPEVDPIGSMQPYVERMVREQYSPDRLKAEAFYFVTSFRYTARRLPMVLGQLIADFQEGRLRLKSIHQLEPGDAIRLERQVNRVVLAIVFVGLILGSSIALDAPGPKLLGMPVAATLGYVLAGGVFGALFLAIRRSRKLW
ncbi:MAG: AarF/ABC1/UbiB kinase family protein [Proteobacteria bacterium]|nr:AarF/ABC1/UbiB kinase family protein [Pseudomonadota bacterium]